MLVKITKATDPKFRIEREIKSLDELLSLMEEFRTSIVLVYDKFFTHFDHFYKDADIILYDGYIE